MGTGVASCAMLACLKLTADAISVRAIACSARDKILARCVLKTKLCSTEFVLVNVRSATSIISSKTSVVMIHHSSYLIAREIQIS